MTMPINWSPELADALAEYEEHFGYTCALRYLSTGDPHTDAEELRKCIANNTPAPKYEDYGIIV